MSLPSAIGYSLDIKRVEDEIELRKYKATAEEMEMLYEIKNQLEILVDLIERTKK